MRIDRMNIQRQDTDTASDTERYGSLYLIFQRASNVNDYGGNSDDVSKLGNITNAAPGSTCLFDDTGDIYRLTMSGWAKVGGDG